MVDSDRIIHCPALQATRTIRPTDGLLRISIDENELMPNKPQDNTGLVIHRRRVGRQLDTIRQRETATMDRLQQLTELAGDPSPAERLRQMIDECD